MDILIIRQLSRPILGPIHIWYHRNVTAPSGNSRWAYRACSSLHCKPNMAVMTAEPIKSEQDHKSYKRLKLDNGLDVLLIHDQEMEASSLADANAHMVTDADSDGHGDAGSSLQVRPHIDRLNFQMGPVTGTGHLTCGSLLFRAIRRMTTTACPAMKTTGSTLRR